MKIEVILPAGKIPVGSAVRKITGSKIHIIFLMINVFDADGEQMQIKNEGIRYLFPVETGTLSNITAISEEMLLVWITDTKTLHQTIHVLEGCDE